MKDYPYVLVIIIVGIFMLIIGSFYYNQNFVTDSVLQGITETVRTSAISNADNSSRIQDGELFISKDDFEADFKKRIESNKNVNISQDATYEFEYLDNDNGSTKAIRTIIHDGDNTYQATCKLSVAEK